MRRYGSSKVITRFKCLLVIFVITFGGSLLTFKILVATSDNPLLQEAGFRDVFSGYKPRYKKGFTMADKANADTKAAQINAAIDEIIPWMLIAIVSFFSLSMYPVFKILSYAWWV